MALIVKIKVDGEWIIVKPDVDEQWLMQDMTHIKKMGILFHLQDGTPKVVDVDNIEDYKNIDEVHPVEKDNTDD